MPEFELVRSFNIDDGELDEFTPAECFVLGYELAQVAGLLAGGCKIHRPVHAGNQDRIKTACEKADRPYTLEWMKDDKSESWMYLAVAGME